MTFISEIGMHQIQENPSLWQEILTNLAAEVVVAVFFAVLGVLVYLYFYARRRQSLLRFLGTDNHLGITIFLSRLTVKPGGTESLEPTSQGYHGPAITKLEYDGALLLHEQLESKVLASLPRGIQAWLSQHTTAFRSLDVPIEVSPLPPMQDTVFRSNLIVVGTSIYNGVAQHYLKEFLPQNRERYFFYEKTLDTGERIIGIRQRGAQDTRLEGRSHNKEIAFIQRVNDNTSCEGEIITVFICAGLGSSATYGSMRYLAENWRLLQRKYRDREFGGWLTFPNQAADAEHVGAPEFTEAFHET